MASKMNLGVLGSAVAVSLPVVPRIIVKGSAPETFVKDVQHLDRSEAADLVTLTVSVPTLQGNSSTILPDLTREQVIDLRDAIEAYVPESAGKIDDKASPAELFRATVTTKDGNVCFKYRAPGAERLRDIIIPVSEWYAMKEFMNKLEAVFGEAVDRQLEEIAKAGK